MQLKQLITTVTIVSSLFFSDNWKADSAKASIGFSVKGPFGTVHGNFSGLTATIHFDEKDLSGSSITASVESKTVSTGVGLRNKDLRNKEMWFNADKYPTIRFHSKKIEKTTNGFIALGDLTIKATTKEIKIPFSFLSKTNTGVFKGQFHINREDYKLGNNGGSVSNDISITLQVPVSK